MHRPAVAALLLLGSVTSFTSCGAGGGSSSIAAEVPWPHSIDGFDSALVEALESARTAVLASPEDADTWMRLGMTYEAHVMLEFASDCYEQVVVLDPDRPKAWYRLAVMRGRDGDVEGTIAAYARLDELAPDYAPAHRRRGRFLVGVGRPDEARAAFERVLALAPGDVPAQLGLAEVDLELGDPNGALARLEALGEIPPSSRAMFHRLCGTSLARLGRFDEAEPELALGRAARGGGADPWSREVNEMKVGESAVLLRTDRLIDGGQPKAALELLRGLEERDPEDARVFTRKGRALARLGRWPRAAEALSRAFELDPDDIGLGLAAASAMIEAGDDEAALAALGRVVEADPQHLQANALCAELLLAAGRYDAAIDAVASARARGVRSTELEVIAGKAAIEDGRADAALEAFDRAVSIDESCADAWAGRALAKLRLGDRDGGSEALTRVRELAPEHPLRPALETALAQVGEDG